MNKSVVRFAIIVAVIILSSARGISQTLFPEILIKGTFQEQMTYLEEKTRIYEDYRAIREDMFQRIKNNAIDSLSNAKNKISGYVKLTGSLNLRIDSLNSNLNATREELKVVTRTKNSISVIGINLDKNLYNTIMWLIVAGLAFLLVIGFLAFKRNRTITLTTKKELNELREEFEAYRKKTRLDKEKMSMDHFKEIQKLKGI
jgi:hypothetical protein